MLQPRFSLSRFLSAALLSMSLSLGLASSASAAELVEITHSRGVAQVPVKPAKVVVLDWSVLDTMHKLGVEPTGIPSGTPPELLKHLRDERFVKAGTLFEPDLEALKAQQPDLIILGRRASAKFDEVAQFGTTIDLTPDPNDLLGSLVRNTRTIGAIFGKEAEAEALIAKLQASIEELRGLTANQGNGFVVLTTGGKMSAFGTGTRFGMVHDVFGVPQAVDKLDTGRHGHAVSFEFLLEANPDWLFVMDRDAAIGREGVAARQLMDNELVQATNAGSKGQIVYLDPVNWYLLDNSGIGVMQTSVEQLIEAFSAKR